MLTLRCFRVLRALLLSCLLLQSCRSVLYVTKDESESQESLSYKDQVSPASKGPVKGMPRPYDDVFVSHTGKDKVKGVARRVKKGHLYRFGTLSSTQA